MFNSQTSPTINFEKHALNSIADTMNSKLNIGLLLREGISEGDLVYKFKKLIERNDVSFQFRTKIIISYKVQTQNVMRQSTGLVLVLNVLLFAPKVRFLFLVKVNVHHFYSNNYKKATRQRSGKGATRKRFPLQKPRWGKN